MKNLILGQLLMLAAASAGAQTSFYPQLLNQGEFVSTCGVQESNGSYYSITYLKKDTSTYPQIDNLYPAEYWIHKHDVSTLVPQARAAFTGDLLQADSTIVPGAIVMEVKDGRVHLVYTKQIVDDTTAPLPYKMFLNAIYYQQLDSQLNVVVPETRLKLVGQQQSGDKLVPMNLFVTDRVTIPVIINFGNNPPLDYYSIFYQLNLDGQLIREGVFGNVNSTDTLHRHYVVAVSEFPGNRFFINGEQLFKAPNLHRSFYIADTAMNMIDTFALKVSDVNNSTDYYAYLPKTPYMLALPTGSVVAASEYFYRTGPSQFVYPAYNHTMLLKGKPGNRYSSYEAVRFKKKDTLDHSHSSFPSIHSLVYNPVDNYIYYANTTHSQIINDKHSKNNFLQVFCLDTNLNLRWRKFVQPAQSVHTYSGYVEVPDGRPGVTVAGKFYKTLPNYPQLPGEGFSYYLDSATPTAVVDPGQVQVRNRISLYPSPATEYIMVEDLLGSRLEVMIYNLNGAMVLKEAFAVSKKIDISSLAPGTYIARIVTDDREQYSVKFLRQ